MAKDYEILIEKDINSFKKGIHNAQIKVSNFLEAYARNHHRYKNQTGNLKKSTYFNVASDIIKGYINGASYAPYVIEGHGTWSGDDFLREAVMNNLEKIDAMIEKEINKELQI
jgi:DNA-binding Lrp family transcriptional regulator